MARTERVSRFKRRLSDRSGFKDWEISMVKDGPWKVSADEYDTPPPSRLSLGGEGDVAVGQAISLPFVISMVTAPFVTSDIPVQVLLASNQVSPSTVHPWVRIAGSGGTVDLTSNPQMTAGREGQIQTLECVSNNVILDNATGLNMASSASYNMGSGAIITFVYTTGGTVWNEIWRDRL